MMKYLGIDYGGKRIGVALSDDNGTFAFPLTQLSVSGFQLALRQITEIIKKERIQKIIIGLPVTFGGKESEQTAEARAFGEKLKKAIQLPVGFENELLTTKLASREGGSKYIDASSAAIILQSYLDRENRK